MTLKTVIKMRYVRESNANETKEEGEKHCRTSFLYFFPYFKQKKHDFFW